MNAKVRLSYECQGTAAVLSLPAVTALLQQKAECVALRNTWLCASNYQQTAGSCTLAAVVIAIAHCIACAGRIARVWPFLAC